MNYNYLIYRKKNAANFMVSVENKERPFVGIELSNVLQETINDENPRYDWANKIIISFTIDEIGKFLALFNDKIKEFSLYHSSKNGIKTLKASKMDNGLVLISSEHKDIKDNKTSVQGLSLAFENQYALIPLLEEGIKGLCFRTYVKGN